jgi:hypothetical protein
MSRKRYLTENTRLSFMDLSPETVLISAKAAYDSRPSRSCARSKPAEIRQLLRGGLNPQRSAELIGEVVCRDSASSIHTKIDLGFVKLGI